MERSTVLIISDDPEFSRTIVARWQSENNMPEFTVMKGDLCQKLDADSFDVAIVGAVRPTVLAAVLKGSNPRPNRCYLYGTVASQERYGHRLRAGPASARGLVGCLVLVISEALRHCECWLAPYARRSQCLIEAPTTGSLHSGSAPQPNNALTSVLGSSNALLDSRRFPQRAHRSKPFATWLYVCTKSCSAFLPWKKS